MRTAADILKSNEHDIISVPPDTIIYDAMRIMCDKNLGAILVRYGNEYVGIWTERDLLRDAMKEGFDIKSAKIGDYMEKDIKYADSTETVYDMMDKFLGLRIRHLLIKDGDEVIGVISTGDVMKSALREKTKEIVELNALASWEYYEEWKPRTAE